jgi:rubrerythrin
MNRDFEFKQLLRAYRRGIISEATFEQQMAELEHSASRNGNGFQADGKTYPSEQDAIISFVDELRANEYCASLAFPKWVASCKTDCIRSGLAMIAERESYHARIFEQRLGQLGAQARAVESPRVRELHDYFGDANLSDADKLLRVARLISDPKDAIRFITDFADAIQNDLQTKEMLKLFAEDELSSATWLVKSCAALNQPGASTERSVSAPR